MTNVFAADFLGFGQSGNNELVSGGNDADVRYYNLERGMTTVYRHHAKKVLKLSVNPVSPWTFLTCSADGTVRIFDVRKSYSDCDTTELRCLNDANRDDYVLVRLSIVWVWCWPKQFLHRLKHLAEADQKDWSPRIATCRLFWWTLGPSALPTRKGTHRLLLCVQNRISMFRRRRRRSDATVYCVEMHPSDGQTFIASSGLGDVRLFDIRMIRAFSADSYVNIFRNWELPAETHPATGCAFSSDGTEIVATFLNDFIYTFDVTRNYEREYNLTGEVAAKLAARAEESRSKARIPKVPEQEW